MKGLFLGTLSQIGAYIFIAVNIWVLKASNLKVLLMPRFEKPGSGYVLEDSYEFERDVFGLGGDAGKYVPSKAWMICVGSIVRKRRRKEGKK